MERLPIASLKVGDVVLVECFFIRKEGYGSTTAFFSLNAISLLDDRGKSGEVSEDADAVRFPWTI